MDLKEFSLKIRKHTNINIQKYIHTFYSENNMVFKTVLEALGTQAECAIFCPFSHILRSDSAHKTCFAQKRS